MKKQKEISVNGVKFIKISVKEAYKKFIKSLTYELVNYEESEIEVYLNEYMCSQNEKECCWVIIKK